MSDVAELLSQNSLVTFRFYAQHASVSVSEAKKVLQEYADANKGKVHTTYLVGGMCKSEAVKKGMQYKLVAEDALDDAKAEFEQVTACHPYSLHAAPATSSEPLYILNQTQDRQLYDKLSHGPNCLLDNRWAAVKGPDVTMRKRKDRVHDAAPSAPAYR